MSEFDDLIVWLENESKKSSAKKILFSRFVELNFGVVSEMSKKSIV